MPGAADYELLLKNLHSSQFTELRPAQATTLSLYAAEYSNERDVAVELPTGVGKSLIALLIAEVWRQEPMKAAILTGNKTLARQMENEAKGLGIPAVRMEGPGASIPAADKRSYHRGLSVAIMNYWVYFNQNPVIDSADLLIMDDAHLAEHCLHSLYSLEIDRFDHKSLFISIVRELAARFPEYSVLQDALDDSAPPVSPTEVLSFLDQNLVAQRIREIIDASPDIGTNVDLRFRWHRIRDRINEVNIYLSNRSLWLRPYVYPLIRNEYYQGPKQCMYMSATIGETSDLARRLGTRPIKKIAIPGQHSVATYGRRLLVMNKIEDKDIPERLARAILAALNIHPKSVWLCASRADAERYRNIVTLWLAKNDLMGHPTWMLSSLGDEIDHFKGARRGHLFVAGRFDGMDFKADECRLVVLATLPKAINTQEEFFTAYLRDAGFMLRRLNQRIVQALGRCNRSPDDFGVYILADRRFATHFGKESNRLGVPRNIVAEIDLAEDASELDSKILAKKVESFLRKDFDDFDKELEQHLKNVPASSSLTLDSSDTSANEVNGWAEMFDSQNYEQAQINFEKCWKRSASVNLRELTGFFKWCEAKAYFLKANQGDTSAQKKSLAILESAIESGGLSSWFNRLRSSLNRYRSAQVVSPRFVAETKEYPQFLIKVFDDYLERLGPSGTRFDRWANRVGSMLESTKHGEYQEGLEELGKILGYSAFRPRYNTATDCRWRGVFSSIREVVTFEAKIENVEAGKIIPSHIGQAHTQLERARKEYGHLGYAVCGTIVTHLADLDPAAKSSLGQLRIIEKSIILKLWKRVLHVLSQYRNGWSLEDIHARFTAAEVVISKIPPAGWLTRALAKDGPFISEKEFFAEWPK